MMFYYKSRYVEIYCGDYKGTISRFDDNSVQTVCATFPVGDVKANIEVLNITRNPLISRGVAFWCLPKDHLEFAEVAQKEGWFLKTIIQMSVGGIVVLAKQENHIWSGEEYDSWDCSREEIVDRLISLSSETFSYGALLDPFGGDATVALAGKKLWRRAIVVDEHEECCEEIKKAILGD